MHEMYSAWLADDGSASAAVVTWFGLLRPTMDSSATASALAEAGADRISASLLRACIC